MKRIISLILILISLALPLSACSDEESAIYSFAEDIYDAVKPEIEKEHDELVDIMKDHIQHPYYSSLFVKYERFMNHINKHKDCYISKESFCEFLLLGKWEDSNGKYIELRRELTDYYNTGNRYREFLSTNLSTSKSYGNEYTFYFDITNDNKLIVGYQNNETEQKIENFRVSFYSDHILLFSFIENKTYTLMRDSKETGIVKGTAKRAYDWISSYIRHISSTDINLSTFKVEWCYVDGETLYCSLSWKNGNGTLIQEKYKFYNENEQLMYQATTYSYYSNIDIYELNRMLQDYIIKLSAS